MSMLQRKSLLDGFQEYDATIGDDVVNDLISAGLVQVVAIQNGTAYIEATEKCLELINSHTPLPADWQDMTAVERKEWLDTTFGADDE